MPSHPSDTGHQCAHSGHFAQHLQFVVQTKSCRMNYWLIIIESAYYTAVTVIHELVAMFIKAFNSLRQFRCYLFSQAAAV